MNPIIAGQDGPAADLPEIEPTADDLAAIELGAFEDGQERIDRELAELALYGALDEVARRRHRRAITALIAEHFERGEAA